MSGTFCLISEDIDLGFACAYTAQFCDDHSIQIVFQPCGQPLGDCSVGGEGCYDSSALAADAPRQFWIDKKLAASGAVWKPNAELMRRFIGAPVVAKFKTDDGEKTVSLIAVMLNAGVTGVGWEHDADAKDAVFVDAEKVTEKVYVCCHKAMRYVVILP